MGHSKVEIWVVFFDKYGLFFYYLFDGSVSYGKRKISKKINR